MGPLALAVTFAALALPAAAAAHIERPAYWPDPTADRTVEIYNRAASFTAPGGSPALGGFGNTPHG